LRINGLITLQGGKRLNFNNLINYTKGEVAHEGYSTSTPHWWWLNRGETCYLKCKYIIKLLCLTGICIL